MSAATVSLSPRVHTLVHVELPGLPTAGGRNMESPSD